MVNKLDRLGDHSLKMKEKMVLSIENIKLINMFTINAINNKDDIYCFNASFALN